MTIQGNNIIKDFGNPPQRILHGIDLLIKDGEFVSISGRSGSGKSTLLYLISSLDLPTEGKVFIDDRNVCEMSVDEIHAFRNHEVGFIFQFHYLLPELTALENVLLPARNLNLHVEKQKRALELLDNFGIADKKDKLPGQMSGGEQQRVAIARALIMNPRYIFADEPTGNLDSMNGKIVMDILKQINKSNNTTIALVTHEPDYAAMATREIQLIDGRLASEDQNITVT